MTADEYADILEASLEWRDEHRHAPTPAALLARYPGREADVARALNALDEYERKLAAHHGGGGGAWVGAPEILPPGTVLGDFVLAEPLGQGAMGVVYRAEQRALGGREVALKVLRSSLAARDPRSIERFRREAHEASRIHAPNVAEVYQFGIEEGRVYFAMQLVEGRPLGDVLAGLCALRVLGWRGFVRPEYVRRAVCFVRDVASGLAEIHGAGLLHRDVKPANVMLSRAAEDDVRALEACPIIVDLGLARPIEASRITGSRTHLGTPAYASPEAAIGREVDARTDVFSLGAILHDLLCVTGEGGRNVASAGLPRAREVNPAVDERLDAILRMALEERRELRYADAAAFHAELERWLADETVRALPQTALGRARLWMRRNPHRAQGIVAGSGALLVALVAGVLMVALPLYHAQAEGRRHEFRGDLPAAREEWRRVFDSPWSTLLPGIADERARQYWDVAAPWAAPLDLLERDAEQAHTLIRERMSWADPEERLLRFLAHEIRDGPTLARRTSAAITAGKIMRTPAQKLRAPFVPGTAGDDLIRAMLDVVDAAVERGPEAVAAGEVRSNGSTLDEREIVWWSVAALGGTGSLEAFERMLPMLERARDRVLVRVTANATVRLWWDQRGELDGTGRERGLLACDPELWIAWARHLAPGLATTIKARADGPARLLSEPSFPHDDDLEETYLGSVRYAAIALAWTRMIRADGDALVEARWESVPESLLRSLRELQADLTLCRALKAAGAPPDAYPDMHEWCGTDWSPRSEFDELAGPAHFLQYEPGPFPLPPELHGTGPADASTPRASLFVARNDDGAREIRLAGGAIELTGRGELLLGGDFSRILLLGRQAYAELRCVGRPRDGLEARIRVHLESPASWPWPRVGGATCRVSVNGGEVGVERRLLVNRERLEFRVNEGALAMQRELTIRIAPITDANVWLYGIEVDYVPAEELPEDH